MRIKRIFKIQSDFWTEKNVEFFGVTPRDWTSMSSIEINEFLEDDAKRYWSKENPETLSEMAKLIYDGVICRDNDKIIPGTLVLKNNIISGCIDIYADFQGIELYEDRLIASIPSPAPDLTWIINKSKYTPRISAFRDYTLLRNNGKKIINHGSWHYDLETGEFENKSKDNSELDPFETLTDRSKIMLSSAVEDGVLTKENFEEALRKIPVLDRTSVFNYSFVHLDMFFNLIREGNRFANPLKNIQLGVNTIFMKQSHSYDVSDKLVASSTAIFSLENFRTAVYKSNITNANKSSFVPEFAFTDSKGLFDAFKTTTNAAAGRHRLLLDNVFCKNETLYIMGEDGVEYNMFDIMFGKFNNNKNISAISSSMFCNNNDPKRIMMTSKLTAQAISVSGESDIFTNRVPARVVFGDFKGWTYADSILISESFAEKLKSKNILATEVHIKSKMYSVIKDEKGIGDLITEDEMSILFPKLSIMVIKGYEYIKIKNIEALSPKRFRLVLEVSIPFQFGDKLTNLHGSKGVAGLIIPDDKMPKLVNDIGDFKAGPFEVIISGFSVLRRGSLGQLFEAWATAAKVDFEFGDDFAINAIRKYGKEMKEFSDQSLVEFGGVISSKPCGIIDMIRLYHHATTKVSLSYIRKDSRKMLNLGNMEKMNLAAAGKYDILRELSVRSTRKHESPYWHINNILKTRELPTGLVPSSGFARVLKSTGLSLEVDGLALVESDQATYEQRIEEYERIITEVADNDIIDLDDIYGEIDKDNTAKNKEEIL